MISVVLVGRLVRDAQFVITPSGRSVINGRLAAENSRGETEYHDFEVWGGTEAQVSILKVGNTVALNGKARTSGWLNSSTHKVEVSMTVTVQSWELLATPKRQQEQPAPDKVSEDIPF